MPRSLRDLSPLRLIIGTEDCTFLLDDGGTFANTDPGGFESASFAIPKDMPQTLRGQYVRLDSGLRVAWEGRVSQIQRSLGHRTQIMCEGYGALPKDNVASMVFVDRDLTRWGQPSNSRQIALIGSSFSLASSTVAADVANNLPALVQEIDDSWVSPYQPVCEAWYDAGPLNLIAAIYYNLIASGPTLATTDKVYLCSDDIATVNEPSGNLYTTSGTSGYFTPATPYRFSLAQKQAAVGPLGAQGARYLTSWRNTAVYGNHGLTRRGSDPGGFYPSDIAGWVLTQIPGLQAGTIQQTDASNYIVAHSVYHTPVGLDQIIGDMATAQGWHWGVWDAPSPLTGSAIPRLDFKPRPPAGTFTATCRRQDCSTLDIREDLSQQYNTAIVNFQQVDGTQGSVTVTADNPILDQAAISSRTVIFNGGLMTPATAAVFGAEALTITNAQARVAGTADIISPLDGTTPAWTLRAGQDRLRILDLPSVDAFGAYNDVPISRVETSISTSGFTTHVELGSGANLIETLQARLSAATALAGQGGT